MELKRTITTALGDMVLSIALSPAEVMSAYREQEHHFLLMDAKDKLSIYIEDNFEADESGDKYAAFERKHGIRYFDAAENPDGPGYLLEDIVDEYLAFRDCKHVEEDSWIEAVEAVLNNRKEGAARE